MGIKLPPRLQNWTPGSHVSCGVNPCETRQGMSINRRKFSDFLSKFFRQVISWRLVHFSIGRWFAYLHNAVYFLSSFQYISRQFWRVVVLILRRGFFLSLCEKKFFRQRTSCGWLTFVENLSSCRTYLPIGSRRRPLSVVQLGNFSKKGFVCLSGGLEFLRTYLLVIWGLVSQLGNRVVGKSGLLSYSQLACYCFCKSISDIVLFPFGP